MTTDRKPYRACLMGAALNTGNMGVSALAASLVKIIKEIQPDAAITFLIGNRNSQPQEVMVANCKVKVSVVNYRLSPRARIGEHLAWILFLACLQRIMPFQTLRNIIIRSNLWLKTLSEADFVGNIHGGDSFSDIYGSGKMFLAVIPDIIALLMRKKLVLLPQTYGPYTHPAAKRLARAVIRRAARILSRDRQGLDIVTEILKKQRNHGRLLLCPDVAFVLESISPENQDIEPPFVPDDSRSLVGININGLMYNGGFSRNNMFGLTLNYKNFIHKAAENLLSNSEARLLIVPHTFGPAGYVDSDPQACREVFERLRQHYPGRVYLVTSRYDQHAMKALIGLCDFFIGSRMHSCIAALSQGIPTVGLAYSRKFIGVFDSIGAGDMVIDARTATEAEALQRLTNMYAGHAELQSRLIPSVTKAQHTIHEVFRTVLGSACRESTVS